MNRTFAIAAIAAAMAFAGPAFAAEHEVLMLNSNDTGNMVYEPAFLTVAPGDTIKFIPTDPSHNAESINEMTPEGAEPIKGKINEELEVTLTEEGIYGIKCTPHYAMGMGMLIEVGEGHEITLPEKMPRGVQNRFDDILERAEREAS